MLVCVYVCVFGWLVGCWMGEKREDGEGGRGGRETHPLRFTREEAVEVHIFGTCKASFRVC